MASRWHVVLIKCRYEPRIIPIVLAIIRVAICFWPQTGYLHPDEFFQSSDIVAKHYFNSKTESVWEFTTDKPIRCMLIPTLLNSLAFKFATILQKNPSAYLLIVAPRLAYTLLSFLIDYSLYKLCQYYSSRGLWHLPISVIFQSSFICLGCLTRTFSNVPEVVIFSLLLVVVCQAIRPRFRIMFVTATRSTPFNERVKKSTQLTSSILVGFLVTLGIFNRPTFPCFALIPLIYWINESLKRNSYNSRLTIQRVVIPIVLSSAITASALSAYDTIYYRGFETIGELRELLLENKFEKFYTNLKLKWVLTPYNFLLYNTNRENLSIHGLNQPYTHMLVNIPLAFNVLGLMFYRKLIDLIVGSGVNRLLFSTHRVYALMFITTLVSTTLLSFVPHQEFRFLLPLIVPLAYAFAFNIYTSNKLLPIWFLINIAMLYFYSSIHQAGVIRASLDLNPILKSDKNEGQSLINVMAFRCYMVPSYQWNIKEEDKKFNIDLQETFLDFNSSVRLKVSRALSRHQEYPQYSHKMYIMLPTLYENELGDYLLEHFSINSTMIKPIKHYAPHFSGEEFQKSIQHLQKFGLSTWREAFGFSLLSVDLEDEEHD